MAWKHCPDFSGHIVMSLRFRTWGHTLQAFFHKLKRKKVRAEWPAGASGTEVKRALATGTPTNGTLRRCWSGTATLKVEQVPGPGETENLGKKPATTRGSKHLATAQEAEAEAEARTSLATGKPNPKGCAGETTPRTTVTWFTTPQQQNFGSAVRELGPRFACFLLPECQLAPRRSDAQRCRIFCVLARGHCGMSQWRLTQGVLERASLGGGRLPLREGIRGLGMRNT